MTDTLRTIVTIVIHTPVWVWPLYALLLFVGLQRTRDSVLPLWRFLILPLVVTLLAILSIVGAGLNGLPVILFGFAIGGAIGWRLERDGATRRLPDGRLWLRGEWWSFAHLGLILVFRYAINVVPVLNPALHADQVWHQGTLFIGAALSAVFLGRTSAKLRTVFRAGQQAAGGGDSSSPQAGKKEEPPGDRAAGAI